MKIVGFTLAKNCNKFAYPITECILQHRQFFDTHIIGVPFVDQDVDGTVDLITNFCDQNNIPCYFYAPNSELPNGAVALLRVDWPNENVAWSQESLDKTLQQYILDNTNFNGYDWIVKIDADEFYNDDDIQYLKEIMENSIDSDTNAIAHNYLQFMGSLEYTVFDPTKYVCHIFKPHKANFAGNDAMQFAVKGGDTIYFDDVFLHHIGYVKNPNLITTRIHEHLVLNASMYPNAVKNAKKWKTYKFEFPSHKNGTKLWPIGISDQANETEYKKYDIYKLPSVLRQKLDSMRYYIPTL